MKKILSSNIKEYIEFVLLVIFMFFFACLILLLNYLLYYYLGIGKGFLIDMIILFVLILLPNKRGD